MSKIRVFISSTMEDLKNERHEVSKILRNSNIFEPVNAEQILPDGTPSWRRISTELKSCDFFVLILGDRYGWIPESGDLAGQGISVTEGEYRAARDLKIPVLPFVKKPGTAALASTSDAELREKFRKQIERWEGGLFRGQFEFASDLAESVLQAVTDLAVNRVRDGRVDEDEAEAPPPDEATAPVVIPPRLISAAKAREAVLFAGSGISLAAGLPSSITFVSHLVGRLRSKFKSYAPPPVGSGIASVAGDFEMAFGRKRLAEEVRSLLEISGGSQFTPAHEAAVDLFPRIITTNYDQLFDRAAPNSSPSTLTEIVAPECPIPLPARFVLKLHGSILKPDTLVITETDLIRFAETHEKVLPEAAKVLKSGLVVVVGTSLRDPTIFRLFYSLRADIRGYCLITFSDELTIRRMQSLGLEPIIGSIESFFPALIEGAGSARSAAS
jgi:hypothetical protein